MDSKTTIALIVLVGPPVCAFVWWVVRGESLAGRRRSSWLLSALAAGLLLAAVVYLLAPGQRHILQADFFPFRGFSPLLFSGFAFAVALVPELVRREPHPLGRIRAPGLGGLVWVIAWLWILSIAALAVLRALS